MALSHRFIWGVNAAGVKGCVHFHDDSTVVYSVGHTVVLYNSSERQQRFIAGSSEALGFSAIALCPSKRFIAVAEKADRAITSLPHVLSLIRSAPVAWWMKRSGAMRHTVSSPPFKT